MGVVGYVGGFVDAQEQWNWLLAHWPYSDRWLFVVGGVVIHSVVFWGMNLMFYIFHKTGLFEKYKLPRKELPSRKLIMACLKDLVITQFVLQWVVLYFVYDVFIYVTPDCMQGSTPPGLQIFYEVVMSFIINDFLFYWAHRTLHMPMFYARIHKQHHKFKGTIGIAAEYASPLEVVFANFIPTFAGPLLFGCHVYTYWVYLFFRVWETVESHSGYDFPWSVWSLFDWQGEICGDVSQSS